MLADITWCLPNIHVISCSKWLNKMSEAIMYIKLGQNKIVRSIKSHLANMHLDGQEFIALLSLLALALALYASAERIESWSSCPVKSSCHPNLSTFSFWLWLVSGQYIYQSRKWAYCSYRVITPNGGMTSETKSHHATGRLETSVSKKLAKDGTVLRVTIVQYIK